jgi:hypothetical protein
MRRLLVLIAGIGMLQAASGCKQIAGVCDCAPPLQPCCIYGLYPAEHAAPAAAVHPVAAEPPPVESAPMPPKDPVMKERIGLPRDL